MTFEPTKNLHMNYKEYFLISDYIKQNNLAELSY